jgi:hypothetical protein
MHFFHAIVVGGALSAFVMVQASPIPVSHKLYNMDLELCKCLSEHTGRRLIYSYPVKRQCEVLPTASATTTANAVSTFLGVCCCL